MKRREAIVWTLGGLLVIALVAGCAAAASPTATRSAGAASPTPTPASRTARTPAPTASPQYQDPWTLTIGQCFDPISDADTGYLLAARLKSCDQPHLKEVVGTPSLADAVDAPYPGDSAVKAASEAACDAAFREYVGIDFDESALAMTYYWTDESGWIAGDRSAFCTVDGTTVAPLRRSVKGVQE